MRSEQIVDSFNGKHQVGTAVCYWPALQEDDTIWHVDGKRSHTRSEAFVSQSGEPVVFLEGMPGYVSVNHLETGQQHNHDESCFAKNFDHRWS